MLSLDIRSLEHDFKFSILQIISNFICMNFYILRIYVYISIKHFNIFNNLWFNTFLQLLYIIIFKIMKLF